jgi:flagellin
MSLGVLNNISAIYAENNLNKTSNSLSTVLNQLSSGSKINSGADDAAGLSLVDGLQANSSALTQSETNSSEGVGLLTVADGALSQVTSLLNRAVTLATEASNGTLNASQDKAANEEYQSILSEIDNIGTTTTYNQEKVFGSKTDIYTGDSSTAGASVDSLNIASLSSSSVGDTGGTMSYAASGSKSSNVFIDLGTQGAVSSGTNTTAGSITISYLATDGTTATKTFSTTASNTVADVVSDINNSGLGLTATLTTGQAAGTASANATDEGIEITGSVGITASGAVSSSSYTGSLGATGSGNSTDYLTGSITIQDGTNSSQTIKMSDVATAEGKTASTVSVADLETYLNSDTSLGVTASAGTNGALTIKSTSGTSALTVSSNLTDTTTGTADTYTATAAYSNSIASSNITGAESVVAGTATTTSSTATISYSDASGEDLSGTDLSNQADAEKALTALNSAISDVAAQDGYLGAQINTLNSVSSVLSTQSENVTSAQNAVQATDYGSATSAMSKYEILDQTGIAALAQANSVQQEVTKLLQ